jgi:hypothetical protein
MLNRMKQFASQIRAFLNYRFEISIVVKTPGSEHTVERKQKPFELEKLVRRLPVSALADTSALVPLKNPSVNGASALRRLHALNCDHNWSIGASLDAYAHRFEPWN